MNLIFHQLKIEFRKQSFLLTAYLVVLAATWAFAAGHLGGVSTSSQGSARMDTALPLLSVLGFFLLFPGLVCATMLADSPAEQDGFLRTRPLPQRTLYTSKALFILLGVLLPAIAANALSLVAVAQPAHIIWWSSLDQALLLGPIALALALFCAHWRHAFSALLAGGISLGASMALTALVGLVLESYRLRGEINYWLPSPSPLTVSIGCLMASLGFLITVRQTIRHRWTLRILTPALAVVFLFATTVALVFPLRQIQVAPPTQGQVAGAVPTTEEAITARSLTLSNSTTSLANKVEYPALMAHAVPNLQGAPEDWEVRWSASDFALRSQGEIIYRAPRSRGYSRPQIITHSGYDITPALAAALVEVAPKARVVLAGNDSRSTSRELQLGTYFFPEAERPEAPATVEAEIEAWIYEWRVELTAEASTRKPVTGGNYTLYPLHREADGDLRISLSTFRPTQNIIKVGQSGPSYATVRDDSVVALYLPDRNEVWLGNHSSSQFMEGTGSLTRGVQTIQFRSRRDAPVTDNELNNARVIILNAHNTGRLKTKIAGAPVDVPPKPSAPYPSTPDYPEEERISTGALAMWLADIDPPSPDAPPAEVAQHLAVIAIMADRADRYSPDPHDFLVNHLARYVPQHLPAILGERTKHHPFANSSQLLVAAIAQGASGSQQADIIEALASDPTLIEVIIERGWVTDARDALLASFRANRLGSRDWRRHLSCLLELNDPAADALLLEHFEAQPNFRTYQRLHRIPRLREAVNRLVPVRTPGELVVVPESGHHGESTQLYFDLALQRPQALERFFLLTKTSLDARGYFHEFSDILDTFIEIPDDLWDDRHNNEKMSKWLLQHSPSDFQFDPLLRKYTLRTSPSA